MAGNDIRSARQTITAELNKNPDSPEANYLMGNLLSREQEYEEANNYFERSLNASSIYREHIEYLKERNYRTEFHEGLDAWNEERFQRAIQKMNLASEVFPGRIEVYPIMGNAYEEIGQPKEAQQAFMTCLTYDESNYECGLNLANSYYQNGQYTDAITFITDFSEHSPDDAKLLKIFTYSFFETNQLDEAEKIFARYSNIQSSYDDLKQFAVELNNIGAIYRAEKYFRQCLERMPKDEEVLSSLSSIYLETGNYRLMVQANERLLSMDPDNEALKKRLMLSYELYGDIDNYKVIKSELGLDQK
jgi:tetratricopeptide (TPR) repeat protein